MGSVGYPPRPKEGLARLLLLEQAYQTGRGVFR